MLEKNAFWAGLSAENIRGGLTQWTKEECEQVILKSFMSWKEEFGENSKEETTIIDLLTSWLLINESLFVEYPADPNAKRPNKIAGVRVLPDEAAKEEEYYFVIPKVLKEILNEFPKNMYIDVLLKTGIMKPPKTHEKGYEYQFNVPKKMMGKNSGLTRSPHF